MPVGFSGSLLDLLASQRTIPVVENRTQFGQALGLHHAHAIFLRHCNLFEMEDVLAQAHQQGIALYVNVDHIDGIHADYAGLRYLVDHFHITGILSNHPRVLAMGKSLGLDTIQRIFALDSTGLEMAFDGSDASYVDLLDISPALVVPHIASQLKELSRPFIASGLVQTREQVDAIERAGAVAVVVTHSALWS